jgi:hypothetical protein
VSDDVEREIGEAAYGRRTFLKRLAVGSAFAVPVVSSFSMAGLQAVSAQAHEPTRGLLSNCNSTTIITTNTTTDPTIITTNSSEGPFGLFELWEEIIDFLGCRRHRPI